MIIGFTGTRGENLPNGTYGGMTVLQKDRLAWYLKENRENIVEAHHGGCVGSDQQFHAMCLALGIPVHVHPGYPSRDPEDTTYQAQLDGSPHYMRPKPFFTRNRDIVKSCDVLLATPRETSDPGKGGTWYTINYARNASKQVITIYPT